MLGLLPNEHWDYRFTDLFRGLQTAVTHRHGSRSYIDIPGLGPCRPVRSGRAGIFLALKALALRPNASIGVPLYCCPVVFKAIEAAGFVPRFIDVDPKTYCLSATDLAAKSAGLDAVIAVHMFGNLCDVPALRRAAPDKPFIEDCAQALGSQLNGHPAGFFGDIAVFSFRSGKYLSVGEGGGVYSSNSHLDVQLSELITALPVPSRLEECAHVGKTYLRSLLRSKPLWGLIGTHVWDNYNAKKSYTSKSPLELTQTYETDSDMALLRLPLLDSWIDKQRSNARSYNERLSVDAEMLCLETPGTFFNRLQYPMLIPTTMQRDRLAERLRENQISTSKPFRDIAEIAAAHYGYVGDCPEAEQIARTVLVIPCNHALKAAEVERITMCVNRAWAEVSDRRQDIVVGLAPTKSAEPPQRRHLASQKACPPSVNRMGSEQSEPRTQN